MVPVATKKRMVKLWNEGLSAKEIQKDHYPEEKISSIRHWIHTDPNAIKKKRGGSLNAYQSLEDWMVWWLYHNTSLNTTEMGEVLKRTKASVCCRMTTLGARHHPPFGEPPGEFLEWVESEAQLIVDEQLKKRVG